MYGAHLFLIFVINLYYISFYLILLKFQKPFSSYYLNYIVLNNTGQLWHLTHEVHLLDSVLICVSSSDALLFVNTTWVISLATKHIASLPNDEFNIIFLFRMEIFQMIRTTMIQILMKRKWFMKVRQILINSYKMLLMITYNRIYR